MFDIIYRISIAISDRKGPPMLTAANAPKEIDQLLTYMALCERQSIHVPSSQEYDGAILVPDPQFAAFASLGTLQSVAARTDSLSCKLVFIRRDEFGEYSLSLIKDTRALFSEAWLSFRNLPLVTSEIVELLPILKRNDGRLIQIKECNLDLDGKIDLIDVYYAARTVNVDSYFKPHKLYIPSSYHAPQSHKGMKFSGGDVISSILTTALWHAVSVQTRWQIRFRIGENTPSVGILTDPTGAKDFLKFRDIPHGKKRRAALIHWVETHWRQDRNDPDVEIYVRKHMRGATSTTWCGMDASIIVPSIDLKAKDDEVLKRKRLSAKQLTRRIKSAR